jgi:hypothetical protein
LRSQNITQAKNSLQSRTKFFLRLQNVTQAKKLLAKPNKNCFLSTNFSCSQKQSSLKHLQNRAWLPKRIAAQQFMLQFASLSITS